MREDIVGMLKNAIERGGRPEKISESLIASGYNSLEVQQALSYVTGGTLSSLDAPQQPISQVKPLSINQSQNISSPSPTFQNFPQIKQGVQSLPVSQQLSNEGNGKIILLAILLFLLFAGLISTIIFKNSILKLLG
ncbi:hypothetical protein EXS72_01590 [Candidatus Pacearchaeota archaeon]|nr:hypothetical protein [Candidatus Pacearchaeota archaeon]